MLKILSIVVAASLTACTAQPVANVGMSSGCDAMYESCCNVCRAMPPPVPPVCWAGCMAAYALCLAEGG